MKKIVTQDRLGRILAIIALFSVLGPVARAQSRSAATPGGTSIELSYGVLEDLVAPLLTAGMMAMSPDTYLVSPVVPLRLRSALGETGFALDLGAKLKPQWIIFPEGDFFVFGIEPSAGLSWSPMGLFGNGPVLSAATYGSWAFHRGERVFLAYGLRAGLGWGWMQKDGTTGSIGLSANLPSVRVEDQYGGISYERPDMPLPDLVLSWGWKL